MSLDTSPMRLLIFTQTVDPKDAALGYYHGWLKALAKEFDELIVLALNVGAYDLPENVTVIPLRPWGYRARMRTALRVLGLVLRLRARYDAVFVHMNQEYLLAAGWLFALLRKPAYFWRNHYEGSFLTDVASLFAQKVFYTSKSSYTAKYAKAVQMPVGVDVGSCHLDEPIDRPERSVLFLGRFDPSKRPDLVVEALGIAAKGGTAFTATFVGGPSDPASSYPKEVADQASALGIAAHVSFVGPVPNTETYRYYRSHAVYVNCGKSGMLDKSLFKSIACGCLPIFTSRDLAEIVGEEFAYDDGDVDSLAARLSRALALSEKERADRVARYQAKAIDAHTLPVLAKRLAKEIDVH